jgi:hypothetical protein
MFLSAAVGDPSLRGTKWPHLLPRFKMREIYLQSPISHNVEFKQRGKSTFSLSVKVTLNIIIEKRSRPAAFSLTNSDLKENHYRLRTAIKYDLTLDATIKLTPFIRSRANCTCI